MCPHALFYYVTRYICNELPPTLLVLSDIEQVTLTERYQCLTEWNPC